MNNQTIGSFCWNELSTTNLTRSKNFYSQVFGWEFEEIQTPDMIYTIIKANGNNVGGIWQIPREQTNQIQPFWLSYVLVSDINETLVKAKQLGAQETKGVTQVGNMGQFAVVVDPLGTTIAFWEAAKG